MELHFVRLMVFAGAACDRILVFQIARFAVSTGPAADEILELHFVRLMVFAGLPTPDCLWSLLLPRIKFGAPFGKAHGLRLADCHVCGLDWACQGRNFGTPD